MASRSTRIPLQETVLISVLSETPMASRMHLAHRLAGNSCSGAWDARKSINQWLSSEGSGGAMGFLPALGTT